jgi:hypothetical protein
MKYWSQNRDLELRFDIRPGLLEDPVGMQSGTNLWGHVYNAKQKVRTLLGRRSKGFVWFFSFLAWFSQQKRKKIPLILLLDEPSLYLHGSAQKDLLRFLEDECADGLQVLYSTQSPYMIDPGRMDRVRIVEDRSTNAQQLSLTSREGTQVVTDASQATKESILPLEGALAHSLVQDPHPYPACLFVEGAHDLLFLKAMSRLLTESGKAGLGPRWTIAPIGGSVNIRLAAALSGTGSEGKKAYLLENTADIPTTLSGQINVHTYSEFADIDPAGIEDLFDGDFYLTLVNAAYESVLNRHLNRKQLSGPGSKIAERVADLVPTEFDRLAPAEYLISHDGELRQALEQETLLRFEKMFEALNSGLH